MDKSKKVFFSGFLLIWGTLGLGIEIINNFEHSKLLYALFYPEKYLFEDCLIYSENTPVGDSGCKGCYYYYTGILEKYKIKSTIQARSDYWGDYCKNGLPVWYCRLTNTAIWRTNKGYNSSFEFESRNHLINTLFLLLYIPNLMYFLYLKFKK